VGTEIIEHLANEIGVRFAGTPAEAQGAGYIAEQLRALGLATRLDRFQILGWELAAEPILEVTGPVRQRFPCFAFVYAPSTPPGGLELPVRKLGKAEVLRGIDADRFALVDPETGEQCAHLIVRLDGSGCSMPLADPQLAVPTVMIGGADAPAFERLAEEHPELKVRLTLDARLMPHAHSYNVVADLPGTGDGKTVLVTCHHDTEYNCPGAVDNASGVQGMVELARRFVKNPPGRPLRFVAFGAEELMLLGAKHYARELQENGAIKEIDAIVNLDMLACNAPTWINVTQDDKEFKVRVTRVFERLGVFERYGDVRWELPPWPTSDHAPFTEAGVPTLFISYEGQRYPHLHLPSDTVDKVDRELLELSIDAVYAILEELCQTPGSRRPTTGGC
jgi:aminopeptidase YwaD